MGGLGRGGFCFCFLLFISFVLLSFCWGVVVFFFRYCFVVVCFLGFGIWGRFIDRFVLVVVVMFVCCSLGGGGRLFILD